MTILIDSATSDTTSSAISASGPIMISQTGILKTGRVRVTVDLGSGEATALTINAGDPIKVHRLELATGVAFKAYLENTNSVDTDVTVEYVEV